MFQALNSGKRQGSMSTPTVTKPRSMNTVTLNNMSAEEARRRIKVGTKCLELQQMLQTQGRYTCEEISTKVDTFRTLLLRQSQPSAFPTLPFVYQHILQATQLPVILEKLKQPQLPTELIQRRGVLKHDVYTTRQRIETAIVPYRHGHSSRSSGRHKRHKRRRTSSHKRHTDESSRSRSRSRDSRKDRKRKRSKTSKDEAEILSDKSVTSPSTSGLKKTLGQQAVEAPKVSPGLQSPEPSCGSSKTNDKETEKEPKRKKHKKRSRSTSSGSASPTSKAKKASKRDRSKKKKKRRKERKRNKSLKAEDQPEKSINSKQKENSKKNRILEDNSDLMGNTFVSDDNTKKITISSIEDLPTFNETDEKSFDEKAKSKRRQHEQFTLAFGKNNNSSNNNSHQHSKPIDLLDIKLPTQIQANGKVPRVRAASKWDDKTLRTPEAKNLKFPKCLPPPAHQTSHQTGLILDTARDRLKNGTRENREINLKDEQKRGRSQSPSSRDVRQSRSRSYDSRSSYYSRSRSRSYSSSSSRSRSSTRSRSSSSVSKSRSRSRHRSRSRSIPKRRGSPSFLERRRITSARKRPIPYKRKNPPHYGYYGDSPSSSYSSSASLASTRTWSSRSHSRSRSRTRSRSSSSYRSQSRTRDSWSRSRSRSP